MSVEPALGNRVAYNVYHHSRGVGAHLIRLRNPGSWANHVSTLYAKPDASTADLVSAVLIESRANVGVTGPGHRKARTLGGAIGGGDSVEVWRQRTVETDKELEGYKWCLEQIGKPYDMPGLLGFLPLTLFQKATIAQQKRKGSGAWWCSELVMARSLKRGLPALLNVEPFQVDPEWLRTSPLQHFVWGLPDPAPHGVK